MNLEQIKKFIEPLKRKVMMMVSRAVISSTNDQNGIQTIKSTLNRDEVRDGIQRVQEYGFSSRPKPGAEALIVFVGGNRDHGVIVATDDRRYRIKSMSEGEVAIYTDEGDVIHLKRGRKMEISTTELTISAPSAVNITTAQLSVSGNISCSNLTASGNVSAGGDVSDATGPMQGMRDIFNAHTHIENNAAKPPGGPTDPTLTPME